MSADEKQVGGAHYKFAIEPWDIADCYDLSRYELAAIKYILRDKDSKLQDLQKAIHYLEKEIEFRMESYQVHKEESNLRVARNRIVEERLKARFERTEIDTAFNTPIASIEWTSVETTPLEELSPTMFIDVKLASSDPKAIQCGLKVSEIQNKKVITHWRSHFG